MEGQRLFMRGSVWRPRQGGGTGAETNMAKELHAGYNGNGDPDLPSGSGNYRCGGE